MKTVAVIVGSLSAASLNLKLAKALEKLAAPQLKFKFVEIGDLPMYNNDLWANPPAAVTRLKGEIEAADGLLLLTPEFNRSFSAALKNALEWGSRPYGQSSFGGKPVAITGTSPGVIGTAAAQSQLRSVVSHLDMVLMGQPELYFQSKPDLIDANFDVTDEQTRAFLLGFVTRFASWIDQHGTPALAVAAE
jgi:chromate reductase